MFRGIGITTFAQKRFPRARGDVPNRKNTPTGGPSVFPAHAGMFLELDTPQWSVYSFPRARGDVPSGFCPPNYLFMFSPRTRGCSFSITKADFEALVFPAHAGMFLAHLLSLLR